jgi:hypothetical protein
MYEDEDDDFLGCDGCDHEFPEDALDTVDGWLLCPGCIAKGVNGETMQDRLEEMEDFVDSVSHDHPLDD